MAYLNMVTPVIPDRQYKSLVLLGVAKILMNLGHTSLYHIKSIFKAGWHYGDYRSKLVHFEAQKYFYVKKALA